LFVLPPQRRITAPTNSTPTAPPPPQAEFNPTREWKTAPPNQSPIASQPARQGASDSVVSSLTVNPAGDRAAVVVTERASTSDSIESLRQITIQTAHRTASSLFAANPAYQHLGITVRLAGTGKPIFAADIDRSAIDRVVDAGDSTQMLAAFSDVWWSPDLLPPLSNDSNTLSPPSTNDNTIH
jgi:hypothetical protein